GPKKPILSRCRTSSAVKGRRSSPGIVTGSVAVALMETPPGRGTKGGGRVPPKAFQDSCTTGAAPVNSSPHFRNGECRHEGPNVVRHGRRGGDRELGAGQRRQGAIRGRPAALHQRNQRGRPRRQEGRRDGDRRDRRARSRWRTFDE